MDVSSKYNVYFYISHDFRDTFSNHMVKQQVSYGYVSGETEYNRREERLSTVIYWERQNTTVERRGCLRLHIGKGRIQP